MKKFLLISVLLGSIILAGCGQQTGLSKNELFEKKQECAKYSADIERYVADQYNWKDDDYGIEHTAYVQDIFYSPTRNSCMYSIEATASSDLHTNAGPIIIDFFSKEQVLNITEVCSKRKNKNSEWEDCLDYVEHDKQLQALKEIKGE